MGTYIRFFDIAWDSDKDGPGTRVVVYLQGCHLRCPWCHSPHSIPEEPPLMFLENLCRHCQACVKACHEGLHHVDRETHHWNAKRCVLCGKCIEACPASHKSLIKSTGPLQHREHRMEPEALFRQIYPHLELWKDIGGITVSGGEPLLQYTQVAELLRFCKNAGFDTAVETSASVPWAHLLKVDTSTDHWLFGMRPTRPGIPAVQNIDRVIDNLTRLSQRSKHKIIIRTPIVPGYTDGANELSWIARQMTRLGLHRIELLPFNTYSHHYYRAIGKAFTLESLIPPSEQQMNAYIQLFTRAGYQVTIVR